VAEAYYTEDQWCTFVIILLEFQTEEKAIHEVPHNLLTYYICFNLQIHAKVNLFI